MIKQKFDNKSIESNNIDPKIGQVMIQFFDENIPKSKKKTSWFGQGKSDDSSHLKLWESWIIHIKCLPVANETTTTTTQVDQQNISISIESFENNLNKIIDIADAHKDHIPPITSLESAPFPYTIDVDHDGSSTTATTYESSGNESWGNYIRKILD